MLSSPRVAITKVILESKSEKKSSKCEIHRLSLGAFPSLETYQTSYEQHLFMYVASFIPATNNNVES